MVPARLITYPAQTQAKVTISKTPVTVDLAPLVVSEQSITMHQLATGTVTTVSDLPAACQVLYHNVAGAKITLDTPEFPAFADAIQRSIDHPSLWCSQKLKAKADEFGKPDITKTYLRITLGKNKVGSFLKVPPPPANKPRATLPASRT